MQANSQHPGQWRNFQSSGNTPGASALNNPDHSYQQKCVPAHSTIRSYPEQTTTGTYMAQYSCTVLQTTSETVSGTTREMKSSQENQSNLKCMSPTGPHSSQAVVWSIPNNVQILIPVNNISMQDNGSNISHFASRPEAFNRNTSALMQPQSTSVPAGPNSLQQLNAKTMINRNSPNDNQSPSLMQRRKKRAGLPKGLSNSDYYISAEKAPHEHINSFGGQMYNGIRTEGLVHVNLQALSSSKLLQQNCNAKKAVAVVTPLSPVEIASITNSYMAGKGTVHYFPNISHPLDINDKGQAMGKPSNPTITQERPMSREPMHHGAPSNAVVDKIPVCSQESISQSNNASSPKLTIADGEQSKSASARIQIEAGENMPNDNHTVTDKKTNLGKSARYSIIPVIEWPLEKLRVLVNYFQQVEDGQQKNIKNEAGKEILKLYWNGDSRMFYNAVNTGVYQKVMEEVLSYCQSTDKTILRQVKSDAQNQVAENFHVLKHNEDPPKMDYKSSWLNLNDKLDDIDRECGYSWYYKSLYGTYQEMVDHVGNLTSLASPDEPLLSKHQCPTKNVSKVPDSQTILNLEGKNLDNEDFNENCLASSDQSIPKLNENQTSCQENMASTSKSDGTSSKELVKGQLLVSSQNQNGSVGTMANSNLSDQDTSISKTVSTPDQMDTSASIEVVSLKETPSISGAVCCSDGVDFHKVSAAPKEIKTSCLNTTQELDTTSSDVNIEGFVQSTLPDAPDTPLVNENDQCMMSKEVNEKHSKSIHENSPASCDEQSLANTNCSAKFTDVVTEEISYQPNDKPALMALKHLVHKLNKPVVSKRCQQPSTAETSERSRDDGDCFNAVRTESPMLTDESKKTCTGPLSPVAGRQHEYANESNEKDLTNITPVSHEPLPTGHKSATNTANEVPQEQIQNNINNESNGKETVQTGNCLLKRYSLDTEQTKSQADTVSPLKGLQNLVRTLGKGDVSLTIYKDQVGKDVVRKRMLEQSIKTRSGKSLRNNTNDAGKQLHGESFRSALEGRKALLDQQAISKRTHQDSAERSRTVHSSSFEAKYPAMATIFSFCRNSSGLNSVAAEQQDLSSRQMSDKHDDKMINCDKTVMGETMTTLCKLDDVDPSASIKITVLPHEVAKKCFAGETMEDMPGTDETCKLSRLKSSEKCDNIDKQCDSLFSKSFHDVPKCSQEDLVMGSLKDCSKNMTHAKLETFTDVPYKPSTLASLSKNKLPSTEDSVTNENLVCKNVLPAAVEAEFDESDDLSLTINILPHEIAKKWFSGNITEDKNVDVHNVCKEQNDGKENPKVLDHINDLVDLGEIQDVTSLKQEHVNDVTLKKRENPKVVDVKSESYCCLAKFVNSMCGDESLCMCQIKADSSKENIQIEASGTSLTIQTNEEDYGHMELQQIDQTNEQNSSQSTEAKTVSDTDMQERSTEVGKVCSISKAERTMSEQTINDLVTECTTEKTPKHYEIETLSPDLKMRPRVPSPDLKVRQNIPSPDPKMRPDAPSPDPKMRPDAPSPDFKRRPDAPPPNGKRRPETPSNVKRKSETLYLSLYGSSSNTREKLNRKLKDSCEEPPETLEITIRSCEINDESISKKLKCVESMDNKDALDTRRKETKARPLLSCDQRRISLPKGNSTGPSALLTTWSKNPGHTSKSGVCLAGRMKRKKKQSLGKHQISMNSFIIRRNTLPSKLVPLPEPVTKSKYELRNPALMPLQESSGLEFKVLPSSFNFEDNVSDQDDTSSSAENESHFEGQKAKRRKTTDSPTLGVWSFSPLKTKQIHSTDASDSGSIFQEFKKKYQERKKDNPDKT